MTVFDYGPLGRKYPVQSGETWRAGRHLFTCGSMYDFETPDRVTVIYADPPWNQGDYGSWHTKASLPPPGREYLDLYRRILDLAAGRPCFMEGGHGQHEQVAALCEDQTVYAAWPIFSTFTSGPTGGRCVLHYAGPPLPAGLRDLAGMSDDLTPIAVLNAYPPGVVLDPCCGLGFTSRAAEKVGWASVNNELHPRRMSRAMAQLKIPPVRVITEGSTP